MQNNLIQPQRAGMGEMKIKTDIFIGHISEAPQWLVDNKYLLRGYRINYETHLSIWKSMFQWHNDTMNIWTHLIGAFWAIVTIFLEFFNLNQDQNEQKLTKGPIYLLLFSSLGMFLCSCYLHIYFCHSHSTNKCVIKADYCGIAQLGIGKGYSFVYYALYCEQTLNQIYLGIWTAIWIIIFFLSITDTFHKEKFKKFKICLFIICGFTILIPVIHILYIGQQGNYTPWIAFYYMIIWLSILLLGVFVTFFFQFPEKYVKNMFDYVGASHQIWHICVLLDAIINYYGTIQNYHLRNKQLNCAS